MPANPVRSRPAPRMNLSIAQFGRLEKVFAALVLAYVLALLVPGLSGVALAVQIALIVVSVWLIIRYWKRIVHKILWRLRNRLIVAYLLIALVPIVLITTLIGLGAFMVIGQISVHLLTSQINRSTETLRSELRMLAAAGASSSTDLRSRIPEQIEQEFPGLQVVEAGDKGRRVWPLNSTLEPPSAKWPDADGMILIEGVLHGWAHVTAHGRSVTATFPMTRDFLGDIAPNLGESVIVYQDRSKGSPHPPGTRREGTVNRLPAAINRFDREIDWFGPLAISVWDQPKKLEPGLIIMRTRPSAVFRAILPQELENPSPIPFIFLVLAILFLIAEIISLLVGVSMTRVITGAVHELYQGTMRIQAGDFSHRIPIRGKDQLAALSSSFNEMTGNLERLLQIEKDRQRIQSDLEIAREVQNQLYPQQIPETPHLRITAARLPARVVSGDYYDFQKLGEGDVVIAIGDVAGKGISAALLMATIQSSFRMELRSCIEAAAHANRQSVLHCVSPSTVVGQLNRHLHESTSAEKFATFLFGVFEDTTSTFTYTNAGHLPPVLVHDGDCSRLEVNGMVVGAFPFAQYGESHVRLEPGDLLVLFTDGISEPENEYGEMFGEDRIAELVTRHADQDDGHIVDEIMNAVRQWTGSDELQDDMTIVLIRRR
jgi:phosphoserine phosphatase RsbU/P